MKETEPIPTLLELLYGEHAASVLQAASERLMRWAQAFDAWLEDCEKTKDRHVRVNSVKAWRNLAGLLEKTPWSVTPADIEAYRDGLLAQGLAPSTIGCQMRRISAFYNWCGERSIDPQCSGAYNPVRGVRKPRVKRFEGTQLLTWPEAEALLGILKADECLLSRRDYAFFLSRLRLGVTNDRLRKLKWGQIEMRKGQAWVHWSPGKPAAQLPEEVWEAIRIYLEAAGRLDGTGQGLADQGRTGPMPAEAYIFAPLVRDYGRGANGRADDWDEGHPLSPDQLCDVLRIYGERVGIEREKLNLQNLRHSAAALFSKGNPGPDEMQAFLVTQGKEMARRYERRLRAVQQRQPESDFEARLPSGIRSRQPNVFTAESELKHGWYTPQRLPAEQVEAVLAEGIRGMKEETQGLVCLMDRAMELLDACLEDVRAYPVLANARLLCSNRLVELLGFEKEGTAVLDKWDSWGVETIQWWCDIHGEPVPDLETIQRWVDEANPPDTARQQGLARHIARDRLILRNLSRLALQTADPVAFAGLLEKYSSGSARLLKLLRQAQPPPGRIQAYAERILGKMLADSMEARGFPRGDETYPPVIRK